MSGSSSALALAARLRALPDDVLVELLHARPVREAGIRDVFDLAEALLDPASLQAALTHLDRTALAVLASVVLGEANADAIAVRTRRGREDVAAALEKLTALALLSDDDGRLLASDRLTELLLAWPAQNLPSPEQLIDARPPAALEPVHGDDRAAADRAAGERAFAAVTAVGELVTALEREPARMLQRGGVALPDWRRLLAASGARDDVELVTLLELAEGASLASTVDGAWRVSPAAEAWAGSPRVERWTTLASGWLARVPVELQEQLRARAGARWGDGLLDYLEWLYPAGGDWLPERTRAVVRSAELLGIVGGSVPSTAGAALLAEGADAAAEAIGALFPPDVRQVYIQHDLSVIAPGPLAADVDRRLRETAEVESVGLASSYRITSASVTRALTTGLTVDDVRALLAEISLTGIPQPLDYLLTETAARFGSLRVGAVDPTPGTADANAHSSVRADDPALVGQLVIDQTLAPLGLRRTGDHRAVSRFDAETLYWALVDARYPAVYEDAEGVIRAVRRATARTLPSEPPPDPALRIVARIRDAAADQPEESGAAWNARQLELAIRGKLQVTVVVRMPDGTEVPYLLEPAALAGGRLRARDRRADIERTLPLSHIVEVQPAPSSVG
ncbi:helicase-associated domain-containing protein [Protaetiibacter sp. SSC-01]|uniref:helicase-associated domain-containing protein n=1 Tax=Protaetiibacter sp. SSC-01 TaxID=2759943 RepID=UPI001657603F|nr:helicase-associated domain-containing protein [Protaetiibacter sp. SSC-01]QNO37976.1 helicase-associated domain-containing protein [Protaetiibacter sp. SSC-01]